MKTTKKTRRPVPHTTTLRLVDKTTGKPLQVNTPVKTFRGERAVLTGWREPHKAGSTGRVYLRFGADPMVQEFFPGVIDAEFVK